MAIPGTYSGTPTTKPAPGVSYPTPDYSPAPWVIRPGMSRIGGGEGTIGNEPKTGGTGTPMITGTGTGTTVTTATVTGLPTTTSTVTGTSTSEFVLGSKYYDIPVGTTIEERQTTYDIGQGYTQTRKEYFRKDTGERLRDVEISGSGGGKSFSALGFDVSEQVIVEDVMTPEFKLGENAFSPDKVEWFSTQEIARGQAMGTLATSFKGQDIIQHPKTTMAGGKFLPYSKEYREITESVAQEQGMRAYEAMSPNERFIKSGITMGIVAVPTLGLLPAAAGPAMLAGSTLSGALEFDIAAQKTPPMDIISAPEFGGGMLGSALGGMGAAKIMPKPTVKYEGYQNVFFKHGAPENILTESGAATSQMTKAEGVVIETGKVGSRKITSVAQFSGESTEIKPPIIERPLPRAGTSATTASGITIVETPRMFRPPKGEVIKTNIQEDMRIHPSIIEGEESKLFLSSRHMEGKDTAGITAQLSNVPKEDMTFSVSKVMSRESFKRADVEKTITGEAAGRLDTRKAMEIPSSFGMGEKSPGMFKPHRPSKPFGPADAKLPMMEEMPKSEPHAFPSGPKTAFPSITPSKIIADMAPEQAFKPMAVMLQNPMSGSRFEGMEIGLAGRRRKDIWSGQRTDYGFEELERQKKGVGETGITEIDVVGVGRGKVKSPFVVPITGMAQATAQGQRQKAMTSTFGITSPVSPPVGPLKMKIHIPDFPDMKLKIDFGERLGGGGKYKTTYKPSAVANVFDIRGPAPGTITGFEFARPKGGRYGKKKKERRTVGLLTSVKVI